jgi:hypothetical protein
MNIVTDNSAIIETLSNRIVELEKGIEKLSIAVSEAFPSLLSCDNVLIVPVPAYNKIVEEFKALKEPKT